MYPAAKGTKLFLSDQNVYCSRSVKMSDTVKSSLKVLTLKGHRSKNYFSQHFRE